MRTHFAVVAAAVLAVSAPCSVQTPDESQEFDLEKDYDAKGRRVVARDNFPVFDDPKMVGVEQAEKLRFVQGRDLIIGIAHKGEAKAYPVPIMGVHELGNDTIGGKPVAVSW